MILGYNSIVCLAPLQSCSSAQIYYLKVVPLTLTATIGRHGEQSTEHFCDCVVVWDGHFFFQFLHLRLRECSVKEAISPELSYRGLSCWLRDTVWLLLLPTYGCSYKDHQTMWKLKGLDDWKIFTLMSCDPLTQKECQISILA